MFDASSLAGLIGETLVGRHGQFLGVVDQLYVDLGLKAFEWARISLTDDDAVQFVPLRDAHLDFGRIVVDIEEMSVQRAPKFRPLNSLTEAQLHDVFAHYGLAFDDATIVGVRPHGELTLGGYTPIMQSELLSLGATSDLSASEERVVVVDDVGASPMSETRAATHRGAAAAAAEPEPEPAPEPAGRRRGRPGDQASQGSTSGLGSDATAGPPDAMGAGDAEPPARRYLHGRAPERAAPGERVTLLVRIALERGSERSAELERFDVPPEGADVRLLLHHPGFEAKSDTQQVLRVPADRSSAWVLFDVVATRDGVHSLEVAAFRDGSFLGELPFEITVEADITGRESVDRTVSLSSLEASAGEVTLQIMFDPIADRYRFQFLDDGELDDPVTSEPLRETPRAAVESLVKELNHLARRATSAQPRDDWLVNQGVELWQGFVPEAVQRRFWERRKRIRSLTILSSLDVVPWELLYPLGPASDQDAGFLSEQFPVLRWCHGMEKARTFRFDDPLYVLPPNAPPSAQGEIDAVQQLLGHAPPVKLLRILLDRLEAGDFGALHFACHNTFDAAQPERSFISMGGDDFEPVLLGRVATKTRLKARRPLVFMNACRTAGAGERYTDVTGWAQKFVQAGAGAFVGSLWEVRDGSATEFAQTFYRTLTDRSSRSTRTLGDAVQEARLAVKERGEGDASWLAYAIYGHPAAVAAR